MSSISVRVGQQANLSRSMIYGAVVRPGKPSIMILDENAPLAQNEPFRQTVKTSKVDYAHQISEPLKVMKIQMTAIGRVYDDPASILTGGTGDGDQKVVVDLRWDTQGSLHKWRLTPRCRFPPPPPPPPPPPFFFVRVYAYTMKLQMRFRAVLRVRSLSATRRTRSTLGASATTRGVAATGSRSAGTGAASTSPTNRTRTTMRVREFEHA